jgi:hypothetical protein
LHAQGGPASAAANAATAAAEIVWPIPEGHAGVFLVRLNLTTAGAPLAENVVVHSTAPDPALAPLRKAPAAEVKVEAPDARTLRLTNAGPAWALGVWIDLPGAYLGDNYLFIPPGETRTVPVEEGEAGRAEVTWWNAPRGKSQTPNPKSRR